MKKFFKVFSAVMATKIAIDKTVLSRRIETALSMACYSHIAATDLDVGLMLSDFSRCLSVVLAFQDNSDG